MSLAFPYSTNRVSVSWRFTKTYLLNKSHYFSVRGEKEDSLAISFSIGNSITATGVCWVKMSKSTLIFCGFSRFLNWSVTKFLPRKPKRELPNPWSLLAAKFYLQYTSSDNYSAPCFFIWGLKLFPDMYRCPVWVRGVI